MDEVTIYTDGACSGNPGNGGWGAILISKGIEKTISGGKKDTTNNQMELTRTNRSAFTFEKALQSKTIQR